MLYFDPICPFFDWFTFFNWILRWENKVIWKKLRKVLDDKFHDFSLGEIIFLFVLICSLHGHLQYHFGIEEVLFLIFFFNYQSIWHFG